MTTLLTALTSNAHQQVRAAIAALAAQPLEPAHLALCAWVWHRWDADSPALKHRKYQMFQANYLDWRLVDDPSAGPQIQEALNELLQHHLPAQWLELRQAASLFTGAYPEYEYIGNGDVGSYLSDCQQRWRDFEPFKEWFEQALPLTETLTYEWITAAQVCWNHFRWQPDDDYSGTFSEPACAYLLAKAVTLDCALPIQYYYFYQQRPYHDDTVVFEGEVQELQSGLGLTYFFYAQFCQYHRHELAEALTYYQRFLELEPQCLPDNQFHLFNRDATLRYYPPSTQEALTEIGTIHRLQGELTVARQAFEQAVALQPDSVQAPYEHLASLCRQQGDIRGALRYLAEKLRVCIGFVSREYGRTAQGVGAYLSYDPSRPASFKPPRTLHGFSFYDPVARTRLVEVEELYQQLADGYFYELHDYAQAGSYYKKYLTYLARYAAYTPVGQARRVEAAENQIRLATETGDYWQARSLCEKLLRTNPDNVVAHQYVGHIRRKLGS